MRGRRREESDEETDKETYSVLSLQHYTIKNYPQKITHKNPAQDVLEGSERGSMIDF